VAKAPAYPDNVLERWQLRFPEEEGDPRDGCGPCRKCGQTFAWRGYDGLCGWCQWFEDFFGEDGRG
jgi:hypothetical protein